MYPQILSPHASHCLAHTLSPHEPSSCMPEPNCPQCMGALVLPSTTHVCCFVCVSSTHSCIGPFRYRPFFASHACLCLLACIFQVSTTHALLDPYVPSCTLTLLNPHASHCLAHMLSPHVPSSCMLARLPTTHGRPRPTVHDYCAVQSAYAQLLPARVH